MLALLRYLWRRAEQNVHFARPNILFYPAPLDRHAFIDAVKTVRQMERGKVAQQSGRGTSDQRNIARLVLFSSATRRMSGNEDLSFGEGTRARIWDPLIKRWQRVETNH